MAGIKRKSKRLEKQKLNIKIDIKEEDLESSSHYSLKEMALSAPNIVSKRKKPGDLPVSSTPQVMSNYYMQLTPVPYAEKVKESNYSYSPNFDTQQRQQFFFNKNTAQLNNAEKSNNLGLPVSKMEKKIRKYNKRNSN